MEIYHKNYQLTFKPDAQKVELATRWPWNSQRKVAECSRLRGLSKR